MLLINTLHASVYHQRSFYQVVVLPTGTLAGILPKLEVETVTGLIALGYECNPYGLSIGALNCVLDLDGPFWV